MYNQGMKAYYNINRMLEQEQPDKPQRSTGLLGRMSETKQDNSKEQDPMQRVAKVVKKMRQARMELRNGRA